jgi:hypothetical protein
MASATAAQNTEARRQRAAGLLAEHEAWKQQQAEKEQAAIDSQLRTRLEVLKLL